MSTPPASGEDERYSPLLELTLARLREFLPGARHDLLGLRFPDADGDRPGAGLPQPASGETPPIALIAPDRHPLIGALLSSPEVAAENVSEAAARRGWRARAYALVVDLRGPDARLSLRPDVARIPPGACPHRGRARSAPRAAGTCSPTRDQPQTLPGTRYIDFLLPGLIGLNLMGSSVWGVGYSLVVARKRKLLRRFAVTAMRRSHYLLSYFLSRLFFLVLELSVLVTFGALAFGTLVQGSYAAIAVVAMLGAAAFAGLGLLVGARIDNTEVAQGWMNFIQLPMWVLSGAYFHQPTISRAGCSPSSRRCRSRPWWTRYAPSTTREPRSARLPASSAILAVWGVLSFVLAANRFRWQ